MKSLTKREKTMISRSDVFASVIISVFESDPEPSNSRSYSREAEILVSVPTRKDVHKLAKEIVKMIDDKGIQIIASDVN
jgi:hypothetical protein